MKKTILNFSLVFIPIVFFITLFALLLKVRLITIPGFIVNTINNISMENANPKYGIDNYSVISVGDIAESGGFNLQIIGLEEKNQIKANNNLYNSKANTRFIILKLKVKNIRSSPFELYCGDFLLENTTSKESYRSDDKCYKIIHDICKEKNNSKFALFNDINPGVIKYQYLIFEVPKEEKISDFMLLHYCTYFKIIEKSPY